MKRKIFLLVFLSLGLLIEAQQITRFAVVDIEKVWSAFQNDSKAIRDWEAASARVQAEVDKKTAELQNLAGQKAGAELEGDTAKASRLEGELNKKTEALKAYYETESKKLQDQKTRFSNQSDFANKVYNEVRIVAESEGYSMVLSLRDNKGIYWYSLAIDITAKVIANLKAKSR
jgi:outer membrane protein